MLIAFPLASQHLAHLPRLTWDSEAGKRGEGRRENGIRMEVRKEEQREREGVEKGVSELIGRPKETISDCCGNVKHGSAMME